MVYFWLEVAVFCIFVQVQASEQIFLQFLNFGAMWLSFKTKFVNIDDDFEWF